MIVVSDTTAISNLVQIDELKLLRELYQEVVIPKRVYEELLVLTEYNIPIEILLKVGWIKVVDVSSRQMVISLQEKLDRGEAEAIALAIEINAEYLLIDEKVGRVVARENQIAIIGTIGILIQGKKLGLVNSLQEKMDELRKIGFWISDSLYYRIIDIEKRI